MATSDALKITQVTLNNTHMNEMKGVAFTAEENEENKSMKAIQSRLLIVQYR